jgi:hypothetical protein
MELIREVQQGINMI